MARCGECAGRRGVVLILDILHVRATGSTNTDLLTRARDGALECTWLYADTQTSGRGRQGREWVSPPGNLYASTLVRLRVDDKPAPTLALVAGVAVFDVLKSYAPSSPFQLKWPNDLLVAGAKIAGILLEREGDAVVIGIGVNLAHHPDVPDRATTSLAALGGGAPSPSEVVERLAKVMSARLLKWRTETLPQLLDEWQSRAHPIGTSLIANDQSGTFAGLDAQGALILRLADGTNSAIHAGDVFLV